MTQEEKAKEFDASLERAKKLIETCDSTAVIGWCEYIFPMLKEPKTEDERIRELMIDGFKNYHQPEAEWWLGLKIKDCIAWLEKQRERHTPIDIDKMVYKYGNTKEDCTNGLPVNCQIRAYRQGINDTLNLVFNLERQGEQNYEFHGIAESRPAKGELNKLCQELSQSKVTKISDQDWSEEDEEQVSIITNIVQAHCGKLIDCRANLKWLKSLKERLQ
jgi:hypothetical protein